MSKIDELKKEAEELRCDERRHEDMAKHQRMCAQRVEDEIAKLEAESAKPREYVISQHRDGRIVGVQANSAINVIVGDGSNEEITVREVKPVVVTREMALTMEGASYRSEFATSTARKWVGVLKAAGIDAVEG